MKGDIILFGILFGLMLKLLLEIAVKCVLDPIMLQASRWKFKKHLHTYILSPSIIKTNFLMACHTGVYWAIPYHPGIKQIHGTWEGGVPSISMLNQSHTRCIGTGLGSQIAILWTSSKPFQKRKSLPSEELIQYQTPQLFILLNSKSKLYQVKLLKNI